MTAMDFLTNFNEVFYKFFARLGHTNAVWIPTMLEQLETFEEKFSFLWNLEEAHRVFFAPTVGPSKSEDDAETMRAEGNVLYKQNMYKLALDHYNMSILLAPHPEIDTSNLTSVSGNKGLSCKPKMQETDMKRYKTLGCGYANRSAVHLVLKEYDNCLADIDLALRYGYPEDLQNMLQERKEKCLRMVKKGASRTDQNSFSINMKTPPDLPDTNSSVPSYSSAIKVTYSSTKGRHVVATRHIRPGEVIVVESSYCSHVYLTGPDIFYCPVCLMQCNSLVPCPTCCKVTFCSDTCRAKGLNQHLRECKILQAFDALEFSDHYAPLALKCVVRATFPELEEKLKKLKQENVQLSPDNLGFDENGIFNSSDYRSVYHVASTCNKRTDSLINKACIVAFILTKLLHQSQEFFVSREGLPIIPCNEDLIMTGTALLHHMAFLLGIFCINDVKVTSEGLSTPKISVGQGIYPALSLMRHSCNAPTLFYNFGHVKIVRTIMPISAGEEVTLALAERYIAAPLSARKKYFQTSGFDCFCEACLGDWPTIDFIPNEILLKCIECHKPVTASIKSPTCTACGINFGKAGKKGNKDFVRKWMIIKNQVKQANMQLLSLWVKIEGGHKVNRSDADATHTSTEIIAKHVVQPAQIFNHIRNIYLIIFYNDL